MLGLQFEFLAGRYHATPWGHQVNEGQVAWPPSPWRLLRAVVAGWHRLDAPGTLEAAKTLVAKLAACDPVYWLPPYTEGHTRHYMPTKSTTTLVFDAFVQFGSERTMRVGYPGVDLSAAEEQLLSRCLAHLPYLGRAESWVEARVTVLPPDAPGALRPGRTPKARPLLAAVEAASYRDWAREAARRVKKKAEKPPPDLWGALCVGTAEHQRGRWSAPPGSREVAYALDELQPRRTALPSATSRRAVRVATYSLVPTDGVLPRFTDGLIVAEALHGALAKKADGVEVPLLTGMRGGEVLRDEGHAYMLWEAGAGAEHTRVVDVHVALPAYVAKSGGVLADHAFGSGGEVGALERVDWLRLALPGRGGGIVDYRLVLKGLWSADDLRDLRARGRAPAGLATAREWVSETPVVLHRHPKVRRGQFVKDGPVQQVHAYLQRAGFPAAEVELVEDRPRWVKFRRQRRRGAGGVGAWGFRLTFAEPVSGPIAVGALAHFGLGRFRPA